tara:strand:- start:11825 stop:12043 length:219 start_codon:yes stop_codon:yes gene_type:complete
MMSDEEIRDDALVAFSLRATAKFNSGIREHNPNGDRGMMKMTQLQRIKAAQEECMDTWFYLYSMEIAELEKR